MTVPEPHYRITENSETLVLDGRAEVAAFYAAIKDDGLAPLFGPIYEQIMVSDWGFSTYGVWGHQLPAGVAAERYGVPTDDPDAHYYLTHLFAMVWIYDERARLVSENVLEDAGSRLWWKLDDADVLSPEDAYAMLTPQLEAELAREVEPVATPA
jgi:hypothetical protein